MSRILLVSSNVTVEPYPVYPLGMAVIASALTAAGHMVRQFDFLAAGQSEELLKGTVTDFAPDFVCLSIRNLDNCDSLHQEGYPLVARRIVELFREMTTVPVIIGGPAFSIIPEDLLAYTRADYGIVGEGEQLICELVANLNAGKASPPILRSSRLLTGGEMAPPLYSDELVSYYMDKSAMVNLQTKRGCPHGCIYCSYPSLEGASYRCREPKAVVDDLVRMKRDHGVNSFFFTDSVFNDSDGNYLEIVDEILRRDLSLRWCCYMRPEGIGRKELSLMKRAGMYAVELGTDASTDTTLHRLGKGFTFADAYGVNQACVAERIPCAHFVMFGGPGETMETVKEGLANLATLEHTVIFAFSGIRIFPGTPLMTLALREGVIKDDQCMRDPVYYFSPGLDTSAMNELITGSFSGRRDRVFPPEEGQKKLEVMHRFGYRGLLWDTLIKFPK